MFSVEMEKTVGMRGAQDPQLLAMLSSLSTEELIPPDHRIRKIRVVVDAVLAELDDVFDAMYASGGRRSVPPETLLKSTVLMAMYSIRSERAFCERLNYDLLFKRRMSGCWRAPWADESGGAARRRRDRLRASSPAFKRDAGGLVGHPGVLLRARV